MGHRLQLELALLSLEPSLLKEVSQSFLASNPHVEIGQLRQLFDTFQKGNFQILLSLPIATKLSLLEGSHGRVTEAVEQYLFYANGSEVPIVLVQVIAAICMLVFVQANWTGPAPSPLFTNLPLPLYSEEYAEKLMKSAGEESFSDVKLKHFFIVARSIFSLPAVLSSSILGEWWVGRCTMIQQQLLRHFSQPLKTAAFDAFQNAKKALLPHLPSLPQSFQLLQPLVRLSLETGFVYHYYRSVRKAKECFEEARANAGLNVHLTGRLGVRTKFQTFKTSQLVVHATNPSVQQEIEKERGSVPHQVDVEDSILLPVPKIEGDTAATSGNLRTLDQAILLALCLDIKNQNPEDGLTQEEMRAFVERVKEHPNEWMVQSFCLLLKARLELHRNKTSERAVLQLQALLDQFQTLDINTQGGAPLEETQAAYEEVGIRRLRGVFFVGYPPVPALKKETGLAYMNLGVAASALQLFNELGLWDEIIQCYLIMNRSQKAEEIVRERLALKETPELWCILGDLKQLDEYYIKAWELSKESYSRAQRSLGRSAFSKKKYVEAISHFEKALEINPLYPNTWFTLGCAAMNTSDWEKAREGFARVISIEPEEGEAWSNLATSFIKLGKLTQAYHALKEGIKYQHDNWRMWLNMLYVSMDCGDFHQSIYAFTRILELKHDAIDYEALNMLNTVVIDKFVEEKNSSLKDSFARFLSSLSSKVTNKEGVWEVISTFEGRVGSPIEAYQSALKLIRVLQTANWQTDPAPLTALANKIPLLVGAAIKLPQDYAEKKNALHSVSLLVQRLLKTASNLGLPEVEKLLATEKTALKENE